MTPKKVNDENLETCVAETLNDAELVEVCRQGNPDAFGRLVEKYQNSAMALALSYLRNFHDAQEIVQEAFLHAYCKLVQLNDPKRFKSWFHTIVANGCRSLLRKRSNIFSPLDASIQTDLTQLSIQRERQKELRTDVWDTVDALPEKYRTVVLLYYIDDYSYSEIAEFLNLSVSTVKGRLQQARLKLKREFEPEEKEELRMSRVDSEFSERVQLAVCQIATEPIKETIPFLETEHIVLFLGVHADVEIRGHEKDFVEIIGTKSSLGGEKKDAQQSLSTIQFHIDTTENYWEEGPHPIEIFTGTDTDDKGNPVATFISANNSWKWLQGGLTEEREPVYSILRDALKKATRVTIGRKKGEDIILSREAYTEETQRIFFPNWTTEERLHGSIGYANLVLMLPKGKCLTLIGGKNVKISEVRDDVHLMGCWEASVDGVEGTFCLYESSLAQAKNFKGKLVHHFHRYGGGNWGDYSVKRVPTYETKFQKITGELHIDVGKVLIEASEIEGKTFIKNRFGTTRFYQTTPRANDVCEIRSSSGDVLLFFSEKSLGEINVAAKTLCGRIDYSGLKDLSLRNWNTPYEMYVGTVTEFERADVRVQTESGDIRIEKTMEASSNG
jgi:RNA polymerase sigma-70 factor (ECF subfamily)